MKSHLHIHIVSSMVSYQMPEMSLNCYDRRCYGDHHSTTFLGAVGSTLFVVVVAASESSCHEWMVTDQDHCPIDVHTRLPSRSHCETNVWFDSTVVEIVTLPSSHHHTDDNYSHHFCTRYDNFYDTWEYRYHRSQCHHLPQCPKHYSDD